MNGRQRIGSLESVSTCSIGQVDEVAKKRASANQHGAQAGRLSYA
jgi:hypothetical protein